MNFESVYDFIFASLFNSFSFSTFLLVLPSTFIFVAYIGEKFIILLVFTYYLGSFLEDSLNPYFLSIFKSILFYFAKFYLFYYFFSTFINDYLVIYFCWLSVFVYFIFASFCFRSYLLIGYLRSTFFKFYNLFVYFIPYFYELWGFFLICGLSISYFFIGT